VNRLMRFGLGGIVFKETLSILIVKPEMLFS